MSKLARWITGQIDARSIRSDLVTAAILALCSLLVSLWGWWTNRWPFLLHSIISPVPVPLWLVLLLATGTAGALLGLYRLYRQPAYVRRYRQDTLDHVTWVWSYDQDREIIEALPLCTVCQTELVLTPVPATVTMPGVNFDKTSLYCPTCNRGFEITGTARLKEEHALPKIRQRIRTGTWKQAVKRSNHELVATVQAARAAPRAR